MIEFGSAPVAGDGRDGGAAGPGGTMDRDQRKAFLTRHFGFDQLPAADVGHLAARARTRTCGADETIFSKGDPTTGMMAVISGRVQIRALSEDGKQLVLNTMGPGEMLGEIGVIDGGERTADAVAAEPTELLTIDRGSFLDVVTRNPEFCQSLMTLLCSRIRATSEQAEDLALLDLRERLAKKLVDLAGEDSSEPGKDAVLHLAQHELGAMMGTSREAINKHLGAWAKEGLISLKRNEIVIRDEAGLRRVFDS